MTSARECKMQIGVFGSSSRRWRPDPKIASTSTSMRRRDRVGREDETETTRRTGWGQRQRQRQRLVTTCGRKTVVVFGSRLLRRHAYMGRISRSKRVSVYPFLLLRQPWHSSRCLPVSLISGHPTVLLPFVLHHHRYR